MQNKTFGSIINAENKFDRNLIRFKIQLNQIIYRITECPSTAIVTELHNLNIRK